MKEIGEIVSSDPKNVIGRIVSVPMSSFSSRPTQQSLFTTIDFRVHDVKGENAHTKVVGAALSNSYVRTFVRKGRSTLDIVHRARLNDGEEVVFKVFVVTGSRVSENTKRNLRAAVRGYIDEYCKTHGYEDFLSDFASDKFTPPLHSKLSKITNIYRSTLKKFELVESFK